MARLLHNRWLRRAVNFLTQGQQVLHDVTQPAGRMEEEDGVKWVEVQELCLSLR